MAYRRQLRSGAKVTYHGGAGDRTAHVLQFNGVGGASLVLDDGTEVLNSREGRAMHEWTANPPRRGT